MDLLGLLQLSAVQMVFETSYATGFFFRFQGHNFLATNKHISNLLTSDDSKLSLFLCGLKSGTKPKDLTSHPYRSYKRIEYSPKDIKWVGSESYDIAVALLPASFDATIPNVDIYTYPEPDPIVSVQNQFEDLSIGQEVCFMGFPRGIFSKDGIPLSFMKQGIISRLFYSDQDSAKFRNTIIIDSMSLVGMSGSPVFLLYSSEGKIKPRFLGLINQSLYDERTHKKTDIFLNDGLSIVQPGFEIYTLAKIIEEKREKDEEFSYAPSIAIPERNKSG